MSAGWVAATVRARAMARRRVGRDGARSLAASASIDQALATLAHSTYGRDIRTHHSLVEAQRAVIDTFVWNVRVLAGWTPRSGVDLLRVMVAPVELMNIIDHLRRLQGLDSGDVSPTPHHLGGLATAWPRVAASPTPAAVRETLATSPWGDPGSDSLHQVALSMSLSVADRIITVVPAATAWASGAAALITARELARGGTLPPEVRRGVDRVLGAAAGEATTVADLQHALATDAAWALDDVAEPADLWHAEAAWWGRVDHDAIALARVRGAGSDAVVAAVARLAVDTWRVRAALEIAARGGQPREAVDVVA